MFRPKVLCGPCQLAEFEHTWQARLDKAKMEHMDNRLAVLAVAGDDEDRERVNADAEQTGAELERLQTEYDVQYWKMNLKCPPKKFKEYLRPERGVRASSLRGSLLSCEVMPEDVVETWDFSTPTVKTDDGGWADWDASYPSLSDEIAERQAAENGSIQEWEKPWPDPTAPIDLEEEERLAAEAVAVALREEEKEANAAETKDMENVKPLNFSPEPQLVTNPAPDKSNSIKLHHTQRQSDRLRQRSASHSEVEDGQYWDRVKGMKPLVFAAT